MEAADHFGIEAWMASCTSAPLLYEDRQADFDVTYDERPDEVRKHTRIRTPAGDMTAVDVCHRADPPSPTEKPVKDLASEWPKLKHLLAMPSVPARAVSLAAAV